jgi:Flp pilus assembly pilin Flp
MPKWAHWLKGHLSGLHRSERAQDLIEYAMIAAMLSLMVVAASGSVAFQISTGFSNLGEKFKKHMDNGLHLGWYK